MRIWSPANLPPVPTAVRQKSKKQASQDVVPRGMPFGSRAEPWRPGAVNGWFPKLSPDGKWITYGFWQTFVANLETGEQWEILAPTGSRLNPIGFLSNDTFIAATEAGPAAVYSINVHERVPRDLGVPAEYAIANCGGAGHGHWALSSAATMRVIKDGQPFSPVNYEGKQYGVTVDGDHLCTSDHELRILHFHGNTLVREFDARLGPSATPNEHGDVGHGYYGETWVAPWGQPHENCTITPWRREGAPSCVRVNGELWLWTASDDNSLGQMLVIGRKWRDPNPHPIVLRDFPSVSTVAVYQQETGLFVIAGNSDKGHLQVRWVSAQEARTDLSQFVPPPPPPICSIVYIRGVDTGKCPQCGHDKQAHPLKEAEQMNYNSYESYFSRRWSELDIPGKTDEVTRRNSVTFEETQVLRRLSASRKAGRRMAVSPRVSSLEEAYKAVQCPALVQITGELFHDQGKKDVGLSTKNGGNNWTLEDGRRVATDIITIKPTENGRVVDGNFALVDCISSVGSADARPTWNVLGPNTDSSRPWTEPPVPSDREEPEPEPEEGTAPNIYDLVKKVAAEKGMANIVDDVLAVAASKDRRWGRKSTLSGPPSKHTIGYRVDTSNKVIAVRIAEPLQWHDYGVVDGRWYEPVRVDKPEEPEVPETYHPFVGSATAKFCGECGQSRTATIHQKPQEPDNGGGTFDDSKVIAAIKESQEAQVAAMDRLRTDVIKAAKDITSVLSKLNFGGLLGKAAPRSKRRK